MSLLPLALFLAVPAGAQSPEEAELALAYGDKEFVSIATGVQVARAIPGQRGDGGGD